jgi:hypothetical protein
MLDMPHSYADFIEEGYAGALPETPVKVNDAKIDKLVLAGTLWR